MEPTRRLDAAGLKALAHPLRVRMLGTLRGDGPATATQLAQRLGESTGTTSWHLRQLAEHGFIEEDTDRGNRRDRWWKASHGATEMRVGDFADRPELLDTIGLYVQSELEQDFGRAADFLAHGEDFRPDWQEAVTFSALRLRLDPAGLQALNEELFAVVRRYQDRPAEAGETVFVQVQAFPRGGAR